MYRAVLFDLDGTLLDTTEGVLYAVEHTVKELELPQIAQEKMITFVGPPMQLSFQNHYGMKKEEALIAANLFRKNYKELSLFKAKLYPGVLDVLNYLKEKEYKIAVATNKSQENAIEILKYFSISSYCDAMKGSDLGGKLTKADIIVNCLSDMKIKPQESVYVGDSIFDYEGSKKNNIDFIAVLYGFGFKKQKDVGFLSRKMVVDDILQLKEIL